MQTVSCYPKRVNARTISLASLLFPLARTSLRSRPRKAQLHRLRAGYATTAASKDVPSYRIRRHTRHKAAEMVERYVREAEGWTKSGLKGVGLQRHSDNISPARSLRRGQNFWRASI